MLFRSTALSYKTPLKVRNFTVGKTWNGLGSINDYNNKYSDPHSKETYLTEYQRNLICEQTLHCGDSFCDYEINDGTDFIKNYKPENIINIILSETNHHYFYDINKYQGFKIAYNVWESTLYENKFFELLKQYDQFWCPSEWQKQCIINQGYPSEKVFVVPEAVDGRIFKPD